MQEIQRLAVKALGFVSEGRNLDHALTEARKRAKGVLTDHQRASLQDTAYGTLRFQGEIDAVLEQLLRKRPAEPALYHLLQVAAYQLLHTRSAPHAVVNSAVEVATLVSGGAAARGFVNGVLRSLLRERESLVEKARGTVEGRYSHPGWWIEKLVSQHPDDWERILEISQAHPPLTLRVNRRRCSPVQYGERLQKAGIVHTLVGEFGVVLEKPVPVDQLPGFEQGDVSVQDMSAQYAAPLLTLRTGQRVLDACAAPGGKTGHILELGNQVTVWAIEQNAGRMKKLEANLHRLEFTATTKVADAADLSSWWDGTPFDRVLLDAPCSGSGVVRRHPDIKWLRRPEDLVSLAVTQASLLDRLWSVLRPGGRLVYATCSLFREENQDQVTSFLERHQDVRMLPVDIPVARNGQILPDLIHDGFFYALLQKN